MKPSSVALVALLAVMVVGCGPHVLAVRLDPIQRAAERHLEGVRVAVRSVQDKRPERDAIGRHRDGFLRVTQYEYAAREPIENTTEAALQRALVDAGAIVVDKSAPSDVVLDVDVTAFDVTTDAPLAGEETFGVVGIDVRIAVGERVLGHAAVTWPFGVDGVQDAGMVGDALQRTIANVIARIRKPTPTTSPAS
jgi:hypothetical protein